MQGPRHGSAMFECQSGREAPGEDRKAIVAFIRAPASTSKEPSP